MFLKKQQQSGNLNSYPKGMCTLHKGLHVGQKGLPQRKKT
jgi:hypothetical protein